MYRTICTFWSLIDSKNSGIGVTVNEHRIAQINQHLVVNLPPFIHRTTSIPSLISTWIFFSRGIRNGRINLTVSSIRKLVLSWHLLDIFIISISIDLRRLFNVPIRVKCLAFGDLDPYKFLYRILNLFWMFFCHLAHGKWQNMARPQ